MTTPGKLIRLAANTAAMVAFLAPLVAQDTDYTATGVVVSVEAPGLVYADGLGQVRFRDNTHTARVIAGDARLTGRRRIVVDGAYNADGTANLWGVCYQEVGTWNGETFTPGGGVWEYRYTGTMGADNSLQLRLTGTGIGGAVEGLCLTETVTRGPSAAPIDPDQLYRYTGKIARAPTVARQVVDDFEVVPSSPWMGNGTGQGSVQTAAGTLTVRGRWPGVPTREHTDTWYWGSRRVAWSVADGRSLEWRVDLVRMTDGSANAAALVVGSNDRSECYLFYKGATYIQLAKYSPSMADPNLCVFFHENVQVPNRAVVLSLVMTRVQSSLVLTCRVLDKANPEKVLCQRSVVDTPQSDLTLAQAGLLAASGMNLKVADDNNGMPMVSGDTVCLDVWQYTDGFQPVLEVVYDNLEQRTYPVPQLAIEPSVTLLVPAHCDLEQADCVTEPWRPAVVESVPSGIQRVTVSSRNPSAIFRAVPKP